MWKTDGFKGKAMPPHRVTEHHGDTITANAIIRGAAEAAADETCGITMTQYFILVRLLACREPEKMSDLSQRLLIGQSTVTVAFGQLEERGAVARIPDGQDQRIVRTALLREGVGIIDRGDLALAKSFKEFCGLLDERLLDVMLGRCAEVVEHYGLTRTSRGKVRYDTAFFETAFLLHAQIECGARECGLAVGEYRVLHYLSTALQGERLGLIAQALAMRLNDVTNISKKLVARELANRVRDPADRRATVLEITSDGFAAVQEAAPIVSGYMRHLHRSDVDVLDAHGEIAHIFVENRRRLGPLAG